MTFDNATGTTKPMSETKSATTTIEAPAASAPSGFVPSTSRPTAGAPEWKQPVRAYFRRDGGGWKLVGLDRLPDQPAARPAPKRERRKGPGRSGSPQPARRFFSSINGAFACEVRLFR